MGIFFLGWFFSSISIVFDCFRSFFSILRHSDFFRSYILSVLSFDSSTLSTIFFLFRVDSSTLLPIFSVPHSFRPFFRFFYTTIFFFFGGILPPSFRYFFGPTLLPVFFFFDSMLLPFFSSILLHSLRFFPFFGEFSHTLSGSFRSHTLSAFFSSFLFGVFFP